MQKVELPQTDPLWRAARQENSPRFRAARLRQSEKLNDQVTDMLETGGEIKLLDKDGKLQTVKIQGSNES